jgi:O-acetyl-ADP-ribose deacetylase (regulator of RNase III)
LSEKESRQNKFDNRRPGLHSDKKPVPEPPFGETQVKLNKDFAKKIGEDAECDKILNEGSSPNDKSTTGGNFFIEKLSCVLFQDVKVFVYQGDITKETADVIVNPANEELKHSAGAAAAIVKAGGKLIQDESNEIMKKRRYYSLKPGDVVATKAGNLPCSFIVHAVGPRWANYRNYEKDTAKKVLLNAVLNCLTVACQNSAASISIPAISSGIFGVPVPICAEILFSAATSFAKNAPKSNPLKDIRFVNIDKHTSQVFAQEMEKRFGASIHRENAELFHSNAGGGTERVDKYAESQFNAWRENPKAANKATRLVDLKTPKVTFEGDNNKGKEKSIVSLTVGRPMVEKSASKES